MMILQAKHVQKTFIDGERRLDILKDININISTGEMVAIVGASGAGKSTLLHCLGGLEQVSHGQVLIDGEDVTAVNANTLNTIRNQKLGFVYQFHHLLPEFNALENVAMPLLIAGVAKSEALARAAVGLDKVSLHDRKTHSIAKLSGGERQRVAIARALVNHPKLVLADEPTGNLDRHTADSIFDLLKSLNQQEKTSFLLVTHNERFAAALDRQLLLTDGLLRE